MSTVWRVRTSWADGHKCNHLSNESCDHCEAARAKPIATPLAVTFGNMHYENLFPIDEKVRPIDSREELRQECIKRGLLSHYLEESMTFRGRADRWF